MIHRVVAVGLVLAALGTNVTADRISDPPAVRPTPPQLGGEPVAVAVLIDGPAIGVEPGDDDHPVFSALQLALDTIADLAPSGSMGALLVYGDKVKALRELGPLATLRGDVLGRRKDYEGMLTRDLVGGMTRALNELEQARSARKALIIFGTGVDYQLDRVPDAMRTLSERAARDGVEVYALVHDFGLGDEMSALRQFSSVHVRKLDRFLDIVPAFEATLREIVASPPREPREDREPAAAAASTGSSRTIAWSLLAAGVALGAIGAAVLIRRRAAS